MTIERKRFCFGRFILLIIAVALLGVGLFVFDPFGWRDPVDNTEVSAADTEEEDPMDYYREQGFNIRDGKLRCVPSDAIVTVPDGVTDIDLESKTVKELILPESVTKISMLWCPSLKKLTMPNSVTSLGSQVCCNCPSLEEVTLSESLTEIPYAAFDSCAKLKSIILPASIKTLGTCAFRNCTSLENVEFAGCSIRTISAMAFEGCSKLKELDLPLFTRTIGSFAFANCTSLEHVETNTADLYPLCDNDAFDGCTNLSKDSLASLHLPWDNVLSEVSCETTNRPTVYYADRFYYGDAKCVTIDPCFSKSVFYALENTSKNPIAAIESLRNAGYYSAAAQEPSDIWTCKFRCEEGVFEDQSIQSLKDYIKNYSGSGNKNTRHPYTEGGCRSAIVEILPQEFTVCFETQLPDIYYSEKDQCYYCYLIFTDQSMETHFVNLYFRSGDGEVIDDLTIEYLPARYYRGGDAGWSLVHAHDTWHTIYAGAQIMVRANNWLTGSNGFDDLEGKFDGYNSYVSYPRHQSIGDFSVETQYAVLEENTKKIKDNYEDAFTKGTNPYQSDNLYLLLFTTHIHR